jgi:mRNA interferase RelE/StbE
MLSETILDLAIDPRPHGCKKLKGREGYRIRKGDFRIIYDIFDKVLVVEVIAVGNRKDIYE